MKDLLVALQYTYGIVEAAERVVAENRARLERGRASKALVDLERALRALEDSPEATRAILEPPFRGAADAEGINR